MALACASKELIKALENNGWARIFIPHPHTLSIW